MPPACSQLAAGSVSRERRRKGRSIVTHGDSENPCNRLQQQKCKTVRFCDLSAKSVEVRFPPLFMLVWCLVAL